MHGVLLVDKPSGLTSHDVVARVRKILGVRRVGHTGTLDPFATGLLILCIGRATRLSRFLTEATKTYDATIRFGYATDTYDRTGAPMGPVRDAGPERSELEQVLASFQGRQEQIPPAFSAKKMGGKRSYELARAGVAVSPPPVVVEIDAIELAELEGADALVRLKVSSGTYVRSLAHDIGVKLGLGAHLAELRRTGIGSFSVDDALELRGLDHSTAKGALLLPNEALRDLAEIRVDSAEARRVSHGRSLVTSSGDIQGRVRILGPDGELLAIAEPRPRTRALQPILVWSTAGSERETP